MDAGETVRYIKPWGQTIVANRCVTRETDMEAIVMEFFTRHPAAAVATAAVIFEQPVAAR